MHFALRFLRASKPTLQRIADTLIGWKEEAKLNLSAAA